MGNQIEAQVPTSEDPKRLEQPSYDVDPSDFQEYDNPKRDILSSNFLSFHHPSPNNLKTLESLSSFGSNRRFSLFKMDSIVLQDQDAEHFDMTDGVKESVTNLNKTAKRSTIDSPTNIDIKVLKQKTLYREVKNYIVSEKNLYEPISIDPSKFLKIQKQSPEKYYHFLKKIGEGSFGNVYRVQCRRTEQFRAIKILKNKKFQSLRQSRLKQNKQFDCLRKIDHPNIIKLYEVYYSSKNLYLVTELCEGGSILTYLKQNKGYSEGIVRAIIKQLLEALSYLHGIKIAHRDIKLENIVFIRKVGVSSSVEDVEIKIIDFGESFHLKLPHNNKSKGGVGTVNYMAPQVIYGSYSEKCDIWSCGVILYILLSGKSPFKRINKEETMNCIKTKEITFEEPLWQQVPTNVKLLISRMLEKDPLKRISAKNALKNSWFNIQKESINLQTMKQVVKKLYHHYRGNNFMAVIESYIASMKVTQQERTEITKLFRKLDTNCSGILEVEEIREAFVLCTEEEHKDQIQYVLKKVDSNKNNRIDLNEFIRVFYDRKEAFHERYLEMAFDLFDSDRNGFIDKTELRAVLKGCGQKQLSKTLEDLDQNGDNLISKEEFFDYIRKQKYL